MEFWADITEDGFYQISNKGRIRSRNGIRNPKEKTGGYLGLTIRGKNYLVHRLVAAAFVPNPEGKPEVNHKDGCNQNNAADNLEWVTHAENMQHASAIGRMKNAGTNSKVTAQQAQEIKASRMKQQELAEVFGISQATVSRIKSGKITRFV